MLKNPKHEAVAVAYLADAQRVGWRAYSQVYPKSSQRAAETAWSRLMKDAEFAARIAQTQAAAAASCQVTVERITEELAKVGFANMLDYMKVGRDGDAYVDLSKLTRDQAAAIGEITVEDFLDGRGDDAREVRKVKFKLHPKLDALEKLGRQLGMFKERVEHTGKDGGPIETQDMSDLDVARRLHFLLTKATKAAKSAPAAPPARKAPVKAKPQKSKAKAAKRKDKAK